MSISSSSHGVILLKAGRAERHYWRDIWAYRELFVILAWRDISVRYKQTIIGATWAVLRPLLTMIIFSVLFGQLAKFPSEGAMPYSILVYAGMLPWFLFSSILGDASNSLVANANLIGKVYFPRIIIPSASGVVALVDFMINFALLGMLMAWYRVLPSWHMIFLPPFIFLAVLASLGPSLLMAAMYVEYRDFRFAIPFIAQFGLYVSPVGYSSALVPQSWRLWYSLNPMVGVIDGFRWCIEGGDSPIYWPGLMMSSATTAILLWFGVRHFRRTEKTFADII